MTIQPPVAPTESKSHIREDSWLKLSVFGIVVCVFSWGVLQAAVWAAGLMAG